MTILLQPSGDPDVQIAVQKRDGLDIKDLYFMPRHMKEKIWLKLHNDRLEYERLKADQEFLEKERNQVKNPFDCIDLPDLFD